MNKERFMIAVILLAAVLLVFVALDRRPVVAVFTDSESNFMEGIERYLNENGVPFKIVEIRIDNRSIHEINDILRRNAIHYAIGPRLSTQASELIKPVLEQNNVFAVSPTVTSPNVVGKSPYLISLMPSDEVQTQAVANRIIQDDAKSVALFCDSQNPIYTDYYVKRIGSLLREAGVECRTIYLLSDLDKMDVDVHSFDAAVMVTSEKNAAMVCQFLRKNGYTGRMYGSDYCFGTQLIKLGGESVEGMVVFSLVDFQRMSASGLYSYEAGAAYDAASIVNELLSYKIDPQDAGEYLRGKEFDGITGSYSFDENLKLQRNVFFVRIENGQFVGENEVSVADESG